MLLKSIKNRIHRKEGVIKMYYYEKLSNEPALT